MNTNDIKQIINQGETTTVQFKERVNDAYKLGCEMVAFSNSQGGIIVVGVDDKISFDNNIVTGEFVTTLVRDEIVEEDVPINVPVNVGINNLHVAVVEQMRSNSKITAINIAQRLGVTDKTIKRAIKLLQPKGYIKREGARKNGYRKIIE